MTESREYLSEDPPFDLISILKKEALSLDDFNDFPSRTENTEIVLSDLLQAGKEYGKAKTIDDTGPQYATMKLLSMLSDYKKTLSPADSALCDLQVCELLDIVYPEIKKNNRDHINYRDQRVQFFKNTYNPIFQKNVVIGNENIEAKQMVVGANKKMLANLEQQANVFSIPLAKFTDPEISKKYAGHHISDFYEHTKTFGGNSEYLFMTSAKVNRIDDEKFGKYRASVIEADDSHLERRVYTFTETSKKSRIFHTFSIVDKKTNSTYHFPSLISDANDFILSKEEEIMTEQYWKEYRETRQNDMNLISNQNIIAMYQSFTALALEQLQVINKLHNTGFTNLRYACLEEDFINILELERRPGTKPTVCIGTKKGKQGGHEVWIHPEFLFILYDPKKYKPYPSFRYTPPQVITPTKTEKPTSQGDCDKTPDTPVVSSLETLQQEIGKAVIHFSTANYTTLFTNNTTEKQQIDDYIAQVKSLLAQQPGCISSITLTGHVGWIHGDKTPVNKLHISSSLQRAEAVKQYMQAQLPNITILTVGKGAEEARAAQRQGDDPMDNQFKRVDIYVEFKKGGIANQQ